LAAKKPSTATSTAPPKTLPGGAIQTATVTLQPDKEMATLSVDQELPQGPVEIKIKYTGILNDQLRGLYLSKGANRNYAVTQMEPTDARRAFPSWDEPAYKAPFDISVVVDQGDTAVSNGRITKDVPGPGAGKHTITFAMTPKMSTYLVALAVGDWKCEAGEMDGAPIRICATPDKAHLLGEALTAAKSIQHYYNGWYTTKYPYGKLDVLAAPDFSAGAMENTALIIYREVLLFVDPKSTSSSLQKTVWDVLAHEMAHQWFGDLVTMQWWNDIWLNEGFATWMSPKPVRAAHPEWNNQMDEVDSATNAMAVDSLVATRPIRQDATTPAEIVELFDGIAYSKTAAVLRMLEGYEGEDVFQKGTNDYLEAHRGRLLGRADHGVGQAHRQDHGQLRPAARRAAGHRRRKMFCGEDQRYRLPAALFQQSPRHGKKRQRFRRPALADPCLFEVWLEARFQRQADDQVRARHREAGHHHAAVMRRLGLR